MREAAHLIKGEQRQLRRRILRENAKHPTALRCIPLDEWPSSRLQAVNRPVECWRSREFLVQVFHIPGEWERITVNRADIEIPSGRWVAGISWDELMLIKRECGRGERLAVETLPPDRLTVDVENMRHLWLVPAEFESELGCLWVRGEPEG